jgi:hypothetical protein
MGDFPRVSSDLPGCTIIRLHDYPAARLSGCTIIRLTIIRLHDYSAALLSGCTIIRLTIIRRLTRSDLPGCPIIPQMLSLPMHSPDRSVVQRVHVLLAIVQMSGAVEHIADHGHLEVKATLHKISLDVPSQQARATVSSSQTHGWLSLALSLALSLSLSRSFCLFCY